jgi:flagellar biosynthesis anti-sigma factor FlgM
MRIDLHVRSSGAAQTNRSTGSNAAGKGKSPAVDKSAVQTDETRLSSHQARVHELERAAKDVPEMRQERVESLKTAIHEGRYQPPPEQGGGSHIQRCHSAGRSAAPLNRRA